MRIREDNRDIALLATVALFSAVIAGAITLFEPTAGAGHESRLAENQVFLSQVSLSEIAASQVSVNRAPADQVADTRPIYVADQSPVRVVGTPFVPNVNPRQR